MTWLLERRWPWARPGTTPRRRCNRWPWPRAGSGRDRKTRCPGARAGRCGAPTPTTQPFSCGRDLPDGAGGADLGAEHAAWLAIADARHQCGRPQAFDAGFSRGWDEGRCWGRLSCTRRSGCSGRENPIRRARRGTQQAVVAAFAQARVGAHQAERRRRRRRGRSWFCGGPGRAREFRFCDRGGRKKRNVRRVVRARADAVHAHQAFGLAPRHAADGIVSALAMEQAAVAASQAAVIFVQAEDGPARDRAQQSAQRANGAAPEARDAQAGGENDEKQDAEDEALGKVRLTEIENESLENGVERSAGGFDGGDVAVLQGASTARAAKLNAGSSDRPKERTSRLKGSSHAEDHGAEAGGDQAGEQDDIFGPFASACSGWNRCAACRAWTREGMLPTKCCSVPMGQIQPQKKRPRNSVGMRMTRLESRPR